MLPYVITLTAGIVLGAFVFALRQLFLSQKIQKAKETASSLIEEARKEAESLKKEIVLEAKEETHGIKASAEKELKEQRAELKSQDRRLRAKEEQLDRRFTESERKVKEIGTKEEQVQALKQKADELNLRCTQELQRISGLSVEDARKFLLKNVEESARLDAARLLKEIEDQLKEEADQKAREIVTLAIQRCAVDQVSDTSMTVVPLPSDDLKGRLIGKEGRNIRAFELHTGVDLIVDDTPEAVILSCFDPVRREVGRLTLEKLIADGRIQPARIEEVAEKAKKEVEIRVKQEGERAVMEVGVSGLHPQLIKLLGTLHFRTSYGQNCLKNNLESSFIAGSLAAELKADVELAKRAALLHDIGKAVTHEVEGPHALIGAELAKRYREPKGVVHAIAAHHNDEDPRTIEAILVQVADAISAVRPGARGGTFEDYMKRLHKLEEIAVSFPGIEKAYAIQAGREIRVMVKPEDVNDVAATLLSRDIAKKIEEDMQYPGQIKVTVIREVRAVEYAK